MVIADHGCTARGAVTGWDGGIAAGFMAGIMVGGAVGGSSLRK